MFQKQRNMINPTNFVFHGIQRNTKATKRHFIMNMICTTQHKHNIMQKNEAQTCKPCRISIILTKPTKPINQTHQNINKTIFNNHISISQHIHKIKKTRARNLKYFENKRKPIHFLEDWWRIDDENGGFVSENGGFMSGRGGQDKVCARDAWENWKVFKTVLNLTLFVQNMRLLRLEWVASKLSKRVTKNPLTKFWKICLSVFCDWEVHLRASRKGSRESI